MVLLILGLLAGIAVPLIASAGKTSYAAAANEEMAAVQTAVNAYLAAQDAPLTDAQTDALTVNDVAAYIRKGAGAIQGQYDISSTGAVTATGVGSWSNVKVEDGKFVKSY